jgi:hypothetical protein
MEIIDYKLRNDGHWYGLFKDPVTIDGEVIDERDWRIVMITDVPVDVLLVEWHFLVHELSDKEVELYRLKEAYLIAEADIVNNTNFKELYGANNQKVRDNHVKSELADMVSTMKALEFGINWIRSYIPLLKEVIRVKQ